MCYITDSTFKQENCSEPCSSNIYETRMSFASSSILQVQTITTGNLSNRLHEALEVKHRVGNHFERVMSIVEHLTTSHDTFTMLLSNTVLHPNNSAYGKIQKAIKVMSQQFLINDVDNYFLKGVGAINIYMKMTYGLMFRSLDEYLSDVQVQLTPLLLGATKLGTNDSIVQEQAVLISQTTLHMIMRLLGNLTSETDMADFDGSCRHKINTLMDLVKDIESLVMSSGREVELLEDIIADYMSNATCVTACINTQYLAFQEMTTWQEVLENELYQITNTSLNNAEKKIEMQFSELNSTIYQIMKIFSDYRLNLITKENVYEILISGNKGIIQKVTYELETITDNLKFAISQPLQEQVRMATAKLVALYQKALMFTLKYMQYPDVSRWDIINHRFKKAKIWQGHTANMDDPSFPLTTDTKYGLIASFGSYSIKFDKYVDYVTNESEKAIHNIMATYMEPLSHMLDRFDAMVAHHKKDMNKDLQTMTTMLETFSSEGEINKEFVM